MAVTNRITALFTIKGIRNVTQGVKKVGASLKSFGSDIRRLAFTSVAFASGIVFAAAKLATLGGEIQSTRMALQGLTGGSAEAARLISSLDKALDGTVSRMELMRAANTALLLGLPAGAEEMGELADVAQRLGRAVGRDATEAFSDIVVGIGRQSKLILDNLGLIIDAEKAYKVYAATLGKTTEQLTDQERKTAFYNATLESAKAKVATMGAEVLTASDKVQALAARFKNARDNIAEMVAKSPALAAGLSSIGDQFDRWAKFLEDNPQKIDAFITSFLNGVTGIAKGIAQFVPLFLGLLKFIVENAQTIIRVMASISAAKLGAGLGALFGPAGQVIGGAIGLGAGFFAPELLGINNDVQQNRAAFAGA